MREYIFPKKIKEAKGVTNKQNLLFKKPLQIGLDEKFFTEFDGGFVVLDFGKELNGGIRILTYVSDNVNVRIRFGESLSECYADVGEKNATNDHSLRDFNVNLQSYSDMTFGSTGFRFVRLDFCDWPTHDTDEEEAGVRAINIIAVKKAIEIYKVYKKDDALLVDMLNRLNKKEITAKKYKQVLGLKYFATKLTEEDKKVLVRDGAKGMSTFMSYYILKAVASFDKEKAKSMMKEYYGSMIGVGATTFFEDYDIDWAKNSCRIDRLPKKGQKDIHGDFGRFCYQGFNTVFVTVGRQV